MSVSLQDVYRKVRRKAYPNEATFRQSYIEALRHEIQKNHKSLVRIVNPILEYAIKTRRADLKFLNVIFEFEAPPSYDAPISSSEKQELLDKMQKLFDSISGEERIYGFVTNGWKAEIYGCEPGRRSIIPLYGGDIVTATRHLLNMLDQNRMIPLINPQDFIALFGVW